MRVCIVGGGAIGGLLAAYLARTNSDITVIDRGEQYLALRDWGLQLVTPEGSQHTVSGLKVVNTLTEAGCFDVVFLAVKAHEIQPLAAELPSLFKQHTVLVTMQNGIPWWYFQRYGGPLDGKTLDTTDPGGQLSGLIDPARIIGCVSYPAAEVIEPGVIRHIEGNRFPIGELNGQQTQRAVALSRLLISAGFKSPILEDVRSEIWLKAWGNLAFNPISALTHATMADIALDPRSREYTVQLMREAQAVANRLGVSFRVPLERRLQGAERVGGHRTSMLQDVLARRQLELESILGAVIEMAGLVDVIVPNLKGLYALCSLRNTVNLGDMPGAVAND